MASDEKPSSPKLVLALPTASIRVCNSMHAYKMADTLPLRGATCTRGKIVSTIEPVFISELTPDLRDLTTVEAELTLQQTVLSVSETSFVLCEL